LGEIYAIGLGVAQYKQLSKTFHFSDMRCHFNLKQISATNGKEV